MTLPTPSFWAALAISPFIGSLLGVLIRRLPRGQPVGWSRSACEACGHTLGPTELIPLVSYAALRGRCRACAAPIGGFHPAIELAAMAIPIMVLVAGITDPLTLGFGCILGWGLLALTWIDVGHFLLPDVLTLPLLVLGLAATWFTDPDQITDHAAAAAIAYLALRLVGWAYRRLRHRDGLGQGDAKLFALGGAWAGLAALPNILLIGAVLGLLMAGAAMLRGRRMSMATKLPFGAPLALAIWAVWVA